MARRIRHKSNASRQAGLAPRSHLVGESLEGRNVLSANLVADIVAGNAASGPSELTNVGGVLYFTASDSANGRELWKSDGTAAGTVLVKDIFGGPTGSNPTQLTAVGGTLYFVANNGSSGAELWKSNGTAAGTVPVADIRSGLIGSNPSGLAAVGNTLYFSADDGAAGVELWSTAGVGAALVKDINPGSGAANPMGLVNMEGTLYFSATDGVLGTELWKSNGTAAGTQLVKDIRTASVGSSPSNLTVVAGSLYFAANDGSSGVELWRSDGTTAGTTRMSDINGGLADSNPSNLTAVGTTLFFSATTAAAGAELWSSDGTTEGTVLVKDIRPGTTGSILPSNALYSNLVNFDGTLFIAADDGASGIELWKSNGTAAGTVQVKDISPGVKGSGPFYLTVAAGKLYFAATNDASGMELWQSDGSTAGTLLVQEIVSTSGSSWPGELTNVNGSLFFAAEDVSHGRELWKIAAAPAVLKRRVFYNNSKFDGNNAATGAADDGAIASDKTALLPGGTATFANYTSFSRGLNGLVLDVVGLSRALVASDFEFRVGNNNSPAGWAAAPAPLSISTRAGSAGSDRVTIVWADGAIKNKWLQVTIKSTTGAGLSQPDVFYFGNAVGETGDSAAHARVNSTDEIAIRSHARSFDNRAPVDFAWDINRDSYVNATDQILARSNSTTAATALQLIAVPAALGERANMAEAMLAVAELQEEPGLSAVNTSNPPGLPLHSKPVATGVDAVVALYCTSNLRGNGLPARPVRSAAGATIDRGVSGLPAIGADAIDWHSD